MGLKNTLQKQMSYCFSDTLVGFTLSYFSFLLLFYYYDYLKYIFLQFLAENHCVGMKAALGQGSNNLAELMALRLLLKVALEKNVRTL